MKASAFVRKIIVFLAKPRLTAGRFSGKMEPKKATEKISRALRKTAAIPISICVYLYETADQAAGNKIKHDK